MASIQIAPQTKLASVGFFMIILSMIIVSLKAFTWRFLLVIVIYAAFFMLGLYVTNCAVYGSCMLYAWIYAYLAVAAGIVFVLGTTSFLFATKK